MTHHLPWTRRAARFAAAFVLALGAAGCASQPRRFALREPLWKDTDLASVRLPCRADPTPKDPKHISCMPEAYVSSFAWDAADNTLFRPLSRAFAVDPGGEAANANSLDEVPDSAWFTNRLGRHPMTVEELARGACEPALILDPDQAADGAWLIDQGKANGASPGFRVRVPGKGKFMFKTDSKAQPERPSAASVIGSATYHVAGFFTSCEQIIYVKPSVFKLKPGLKSADNSGVEKPFDDAALKHVLEQTSRRGELIRLQASAWLPGELLGPFRYAGTRSDDPNDILPHQDRRDLRGGRLIAAWLNHFDAREQNSMDTWIGEDKEHEATSPGYVRHYYLDTSDTLGSEWDWNGISRRLGHSYLLDFQDVAVDLVTLGVDLARLRNVSREDRFHYHASLSIEGAAQGKSVPVVQGKSSEVCMNLPHVAADGGSPDDAPGRYVIVQLTNGVAPGPLAAHLYDLGPARGFKLAGIERLYP